MSSKVHRVQLLKVFQRLPFFLSNNLYNEVSKTKVMTDRIEERISDLDDMLVVRTGLSYTLTDEAKKIKFKMLKEASKNTLMHESVFDFLY